RSHYCPSGPAVGRNDSVLAVADPAVAPVARWLLAPGVYLGVAALGIIVGISLGWFTDGIGRRPAQYAVKMENWKNDPHVKEVQAIYDEIRAGVKNSRYEIETRNFDVESSLCSSSYPITSKSLVED